MVDHKIHFDTHSDPVMVPTGTLLVEAARKAEIDLQQPCGGQGRCGRCVVQVNNGHIRSRSTLRLSNADIEAGYVLACQSVVEGDAEIIIPPQEDRMLRRNGIEGGTNIRQVIAGLIAA